ncbi:MAG TPA: DUF2203 domain-containing protein [Terriglobales bacterium]|nr:DUF2203 domain-containing protein [Terriglobales bacterium]
MAKHKTFTLQEAHALLPVLKSLLKKAMDKKQQVQEIEKEFRDLKHRILLSGGLLVDVAAAARKRAGMVKAYQEIKDAAAEISAIGVQVKDLDIGLLDFPCRVEVEIVLLCWKYGEEGITHWHGLEEGFAGRKPIDERITKARKKERPS